MAVALDAASAKNTELTTNTAWDDATFTVGSGSNRALIVALVFGATPIPTTVTVHWDSAGANQSMTLIGNVSESGNPGSTAIYGLVAPTSGNKNLHITSSTSTQVTVNYISFTGVDQTGGTTSFPNMATVPTASIAGGANQTLTITAATDGAAVASWLCSNIIAQATGAIGTAWWTNLTATNDDNAGRYIVPSTASNAFTMKNNTGGNSSMAAVGCAVAAAAAGASSQPFSKLALIHELAEIEWVPPLVPEPLPTLAKKRTPATAEAAVLGAPVGPDHNHLIGKVIAPAWQPPDPLPTLQSNTAVGRSADRPINNIPPDLNVITALAAWWQAADPLPTLPAPDAAVAAPVAPALVSSLPSEQILGSIGQAWIAPDPLPTLSNRLTRTTAESAVIGAPNSWNDVQQNAVAAAWVPPDPLPTLTAKLTRATAEASVRGAPRAPDTIQQVILPAWVPPDPLPTLTSKTAVGRSVDRPQPDEPVYSTSLEEVLTQWVPPDPLPTLNQKLTRATAEASVLGAVNSWNDVQQCIVSAWWGSADPLPTLPVKLLAGLSVDNPPRKSASVAIPQQQPSDPLPTLPLKLVPISAQFQPAIQYNVAVAVNWLPLDPLPTLPKLGAAVIPPPAVNNPPFGIPSDWAIQVSVAWIPPDPLPTLGVHIAVAAGTVVVPFQPSTAGLQRVVAAQILPAWIPPDPQPWLPLTRKPATAESFVKSPKAPDPHTVEVLAWQPPDPLPTLPVKLLAGLSTDRPLNNIATDVAVQSVVLSAWIVTDPIPTLPPKLLAGLSVDNPPRLRRQPDAPQIAQDAPTQAPAKIAAIIPAAAPSQPPRKPDQQVAAAQAWQQSDPQPTLNRLVAAIAISPIRPILTQRPVEIANRIALDWQPPDPLPTLNVKVAALIPPPPVNNPPFGLQRNWAVRIAGAWQQPDPFPVLRPGIAANAPSLNVLVNPAYLVDFFGYTRVVRFGSNYVR